MIRKVLKGKTTGFLSYGQSGAGKTYTTFGDQKTGASMLTSGKGIAQNAVLELLKTMAFETMNYEIYASVIEIYVDQIRDLGALYVEEQKRASIFCREKNNAY